MDNQNKVTVGYHEKPWVLETYVNIVNRLVELTRKAQAEENKNLSLFKKEMIDTKNSPKFLRKQRLNASRIVQQTRSDEIRRKWREELASMEEEISGSYVELQYLYDEGIRKGMAKYYSAVQNLELKANNFGLRYSKTGWEGMSSVFLDHIETDNRAALYYISEYSPVAGKLADFIRPWQVKMATKENPDLGKIGVLLTMLKNFPQLLSRIVGDSNTARNFAIPKGVPVGEDPADILFFTLLRTPTSFLKTL